MSGVRHTRDLAFESCGVVLKVLNMKTVSKRKTICCCVVMENSVSLLMWQNFQSR